MAASTAASAAGSFGFAESGGIFAQQNAMFRDKVNRKRWNKMSDAEVRALYDKGGSRSQGAFDEIQRRTFSLGIWLNTETTWHLHTSILRNNLTI